jgi:hypothetical protein
VNEILSTGSGWPPVHKTWAQAGKACGLIVENSPQRLWKRVDIYRA